MSIGFFVTFSVYFITFAYCFYSYIYLTNQKNVEQPAKSVTFCTTVKNSADIGVFYSDISRVFYIFSIYFLHILLYLVVGCVVHTYYYDNVCT